MQSQQEYSNEAYETYLGCFKKRASWQSMPNRTIITNVPDEQLPTNEICTSKYSFITFIPYNLMEQFSKTANIYFLVIAIMQTVTLISITNGQPVILGPLAVVVSINYKRRVSDSQENNRVSFTLTQNNILWKSIRVGHVIKVIENQYFPADVLLLSSSDPKGICYIETKSLDGETNLKTKKIHSDMKSDDVDWNTYKLEIRYEKPNPFIYKFQGNTTFQQNLIPLDQNNLVLRGFLYQLIIFKWVIGLVVYNGHDTKIMLNSVQARPKKSHLEYLMNWFIILIFFIQLVICFFCAFSSSIWNKEHINQLSYLEITSDDHERKFFLNLITKWGNWILIFTNFVPISLLVSLEMVKFLQGIAIVLDKGTTFQNQRATVQTSSLNEELGQVSYIFSDKTGTLTKNIMDFKCITVNGKVYGDEKNFKPSLAQSKISNVDFADYKLFHDLKEPHRAEMLREFLFSLAICHTVVVSKDQSDNLVYNASSPDELALINFSRFCGFEYLGQDLQSLMTIKVDNIEYKFKLIHVLEFNSTRKRMSVVVQNDQGEYILYTKGADSVIEKRLNAFFDPNIKITLWQNLEEFARKGLRTLLIAKRVISTEIFKDWNERYMKACAAIENRDEMMDQLQSEIEDDLIVVGGTGIEDKLQDDVGATIKSLQEAGIQIWVLTGDKIETAINIGFSCNLLNDSMEQIIIDGHQQIEERLDEWIHTIESHPKSYVLIISGEALLASVHFAEKIMHIGKYCKSVLACRVSPKDKAEIVLLVRKHLPTVVTLAIGDGANDVNMITAAHIGIGIRGVEGQQAARASDYAIGEFRILQRLLFYHGRENYRRNSHLVLYNFFKNMMLVLPQFWYGFYNGFSGVSLYDPYMYQCYNLFYTSLPIVIYSLFDEEFTSDHLMKEPSLYEIGMKNQLFTIQSYLYWIGSGALQAAFPGFLMYQMIENNFITPDGWMECFASTGLITLGFAVYNGNIKIVLFSNTHTIASVIILVLSVLVFIVNAEIISDFFITSDIGKTFLWSYGVGSFYLIIYSLFGLTSMLDFAVTRWILFKLYSSAKKVDFAKASHIELVDNFAKDNSEMMTSSALTYIQERKYTGFAYSAEEPLDFAQKESQL